MFSVGISPPLKPVVGQEFSQSHILTVFGGSVLLVHMCKEKGWHAALHTHSEDQQGDEITSFMSG